MAEEFRVLRPREYHSQLVSKGQRADGRALKETRDLKLEIDAIRTADSSSLVKLGNTSLVCGCISQILPLRDRNEDNEEIKIKVELPPICSGPTGYKTQHISQLLTRTLKQIIEDTNCLDKETFQLRELDCYWCVDIEVICLNYDGCLLDAALIAVLSALKTLKVSNNSSEATSRSVKLNSTPICSSFAIIGDSIVCDPNLEEETVSQSTFSITIDTKTNRCAHINKIGGKSVHPEKLFECIQLARARADKLKHFIDGINEDLTMDQT